MNTTSKLSKVIAALLITSILISSCSPTKLSSYATETSLSGKAKFDFNQSKIRANGKGFSIDMKALGKMPKRIALVSFYVDDPGITKVSGSNYSGKTYNTTNTGSTNAQFYANYFLNASIQNIKEGFNKYGMEVLLPNEFLTSQEKKDAYNNFVVQHTTLNKIGQGLSKFVKNMGNMSTSIETDEAADGFKLVKINNRETSDAKKVTVQTNNLNGSIDGQMIESVGYELAKVLDVDAVLVIYNSQLANEKWGKSRFYLCALNMHLFGPNPTPLKEGKRDGNGYSKGLFYCGVRMPFKKGLIINPKFKDDKEKETNDNLNVTAYQNMVNGCIKKMGDYLKKELN